MWFQLSDISGPLQELQLKLVRELQEFMPGAFLFWQVSGA